MTPRNEIRCLKLINSAISTFDLNLSGFVVLTEAASNYYMLTPMIAALANADRVYAITKDSKHGKAADICEATHGLAQRWGISSKVEVILSRNDPRISDADIVTNLGFVRPLDKTLLRSLKPMVAIPLMWETWEYRKEDLDLQEAKRLGIPVLGTNESHKSLKTMEYIGIAALKMLLNMDIEIICSDIVVLGNDDFANPIILNISNAGGTPYYLNVTVQGEYDVKSFWKFIENADALIICEHRSKKPLIGMETQLSANEIYKRNPGVVVIHMCGNVPTHEIRNSGLRYSPPSFALPGFMSVTSDYVGPKPLIELHTAGLHIGELLARKRRRGLDRIDAEKAVLKETSLAQRFNFVA